MKEKIRNSELTIFEGRAHTPIYQNVAEFSARILRFLKRVGGNREPPHRSGLLLFGRLRNRVRTVKQENRLSRRLALSEMDRDATPSLRWEPDADDAPS